MNNIRLNFGLQYTRSQVEWDLGTVAKWDELYSSLTFSIVNDLEGNIIMRPNSIALYFGAVYSDIASSSFKGSGQAGFTVGLQVFMTEKTSLQLGMENLEKSGYTAGVHFRF